MPIYSFCFIFAKTKNNAIATDKLRIDDIKNQFKNKPVFGLQDIVAFYEQSEKDINRATINWRVYSLVQSGILRRVGRGLFGLGEGKSYTPEVYPATKTVFKKLKEAFPFMDLCIWRTSVFNEFMQHQPNRFFVLIEVNREATESVFYFLKESKREAFLEPTSDILEKYIPSNKETFIVKPLVSEAPTQYIDGIVTTTIEKMLVDIFCDEVIFSAQQGAEMRTIFEEAFAKYAVNQSKMLRYASRRGKQEELIQFIKPISNLWQYKQSIANL